MKHILDRKPPHYVYKYKPYTIDELDNLQDKRIWATVVYVIKAMRKEMKDIKEQVEEEYKGALENMKREIDDLENHLEELRFENDYKQETINELRVCVSDLKYENNNLQERIHKLEEENQSLEEENAELKVEIKGE